MRRQDFESGNSVLLAGAAFAVGVVAGVVLKDTGKQIYERARGALGHREYERTIVYDENLPESLERREPTPDSGQPRFGGTGAIGVSPAAVVNAQEATKKREGA